MAFIQLNLTIFKVYFFAIDGDNNGDVLVSSVMDTDNPLYVRLTDGDGGDVDDDDSFLVRSSVHVELDDERQETPREKGPANCWWLNRAQNGGTSTAHRPDGSGQLQGTPYMTRRSKQVRVKAVLGDQVVRMIVQGSNIREGVKQMDDAGMFHPQGAHAQTRYQMLAFE